MEVKIEPKNPIPQLKEEDTKHVSVKTECMGESCGDITFDGNGSDMDIKEHNEFKISVNTEQQYSLEENSCLKKNHQSTHEKQIAGKSFACKVCDFKRNQNANKKPYACQWCSFKCIYKTTLDNHVMTHTGEKPMACTLCDYKCILKFDLRKHMLTHTRQRKLMAKCKNDIRFYPEPKVCIPPKKENPVQIEPCRLACELCCFRTDYETSFLRHIQTHPNENSFACKLCNYKCNQNAGLIVHMETHTEKAKVCHTEKANVCHTEKANVCHTEKANVCHTEKAKVCRSYPPLRYTCQFCSRRYAYQSSFDRHMLTHTSQKTYFLQYFSL